MLEVIYIYFMRLNTVDKVHKPKVKMSMDILHMICIYM